MKLMIFLIISIAILIVIIFEIAQYTRDSKLKKFCKKIAQTLLLGIIPLSDKERKSFFIKKPNLF